MKKYSNVIILLLVGTNILSICGGLFLYKKFLKLRRTTDAVSLVSQTTPITSNAINKENITLPRTAEKIVELTFMDDKAVQDIYQMLKDTVEILEQANVQYSTDGGTMMGMVRNKGLIPWDDDVDLLIFHHDEPKLRQLKPIFEKLGYNLIFDYSVYRVSKIGNPTTNGIRFTYPVLEISLVYHNKSSKRVEYTNWMMLDTFPKEWFPEDKFFPLKRYKFGPLYVYGPNEPEWYLNHYYGTSWKQQAQIYPRHFQPRHMDIITVDINEIFGTYAVPKFALLDRVRFMQQDFTALGILKDR